MLAHHLALLFAYTHASNPIVSDVSIADPHIRIFNDSAYMYAGKDGNRHPMGFKMPEWHVWRSHDLVNWDDITTILPSQTYMDDKEECWATDVVWSKEAGHYAFFFSHGGISMGVMTATSPTLADAKDVLGRPLISSSINPDTKPGVTVTNLTRGAYDPTLLVDDLTDSTYVCFGVKDYSHKHSAVNSDYAIARLHPNLTALAEPPRRVVFLPNPLDNSTMIDDDKSTLHVHNGVYYLSAGSYYATATNPYGPYTFRGSTNPQLNRGILDYRTFGDTSQAHGRYFTWKSQWFHVW